MLDAQQLVDELQCAICLGQLFKPATLTCGHSYCRLCLIDACTGQDETFSSCICPICRESIGFEISKLSVNVALWNVVRLVCPSAQCERVEEANFQRAVADCEKLAGNTAAERQSRLSDSAETPNDDDEYDDDDEDGDDGFGDEVYEEDDVESDTYVIDGEARSIVRGIVSPDGRSSIALGIVRFPGCLQTHCLEQECTIAMLHSTAVDENEFPVVVSELHEGWVQRRSPHPSLMTLTVLNRSDEIVLERTSLPVDGRVTFPNLYVDGPSGEYAFRFYDLFTGASMEVKALLRATRRGSLVG
ncbi:hypothetical protein SDRG_05421 [Saprolegnia diclina VS20]|uniref:RING-type E3 ubiquitin transferase n=1 Tax=Saprolegnia diclina (strain VS20) TaxID=1156394 RepID=T0QT59_SAPDV|nr:hypothetical protein SDRG_05421 [Saprolegnia diclina VS20]EQC37195.1 hypothetical protein SDRG_05421 [Saprolegnia diclina VS20]|eukprot:XP_008609357.1 hypothetical protein SDRG_05421 [Saprolegnia diclina VS20]